jgi:hypothetical protein
MTVTNDSETTLFKMWNVEHNSKFPMITPTNESKPLFEIG